MEKGDKIKNKNGFVLLKSKEDVREWLNSQKITRTINKLQVHMMYLPSYSTWENTDNFEIMANKIRTIIGKNNSNE